MVELQGGHFKTVGCRDTPGLGVPEKKGHRLLVRNMLGHRKTHRPISRSGVSRAAALVDGNQVIAGFQAVGGGRFEDRTEAFQSTNVNFRDPVTAKIPIVADYRERPVRRPPGQRKDNSEPDR